ncbi:MAG: hypothetical protein M1825_003933 [Sarcosagium campestre]|nr:MAG: hypothetical protein M1825_003933 [Sarcosagium campestre]
MLGISGIKLVTQLVLGLSVWSASANAEIAAGHSVSRRDAPLLRDVWVFPNQTWIENIAVRANGQLLVSLLTSPDLYQVNPFKEEPPTLIHKFTDSASVFGITELEDDVFAVSVGNYSAVTFSTTPGTWSIWKVDLRPAKDGSPAAISLVTKIPEAGVLNGVTTLDADAGLVLAADSVKGDVYRIDVSTGEYKVVLKDDLTSPEKGTSKLAVNGIHIFKGFLYFTNSYRFFLGRVPIDAQGSAIGPFEKFADTKLGDDFAIDGAGNIFLTQESTLVKITPDGKSSVLAGSANSTDLAGDTAAQFGRTANDLGTLYVVTNGGISIPVNGSYVSGGKVVAVDLHAKKQQEYTALSHWQSLQLYIGSPFYIS